MQNKNMLASILFFFIGFASMAQGSGPPPPSGPTPPGLPIDGGVIALFVSVMNSALLHSQSDPCMPKLSRWVIITT